MKTKKYLKKLYLETKILFMVLIILLSPVLFFSGMHAIDLCRNELHIQQMTNKILAKYGTSIELSETTIEGNSVYSIESGECHRFGMMQVFVGYIFVFGMLVSIVIKKGNVIR